MFLAQNVCYRVWGRGLFFTLALSALIVAFLAHKDLLSASQAESTFVVTNANDSGPGSLRQAMIDANANPGLDTITFNIGSGHQIIKPLEPLPTVTDPVVIDGTSQPGFSGTPIIELDSSIPVVGSGLFLNSGNSTVRSMVINGSPSNGISIAKNGNRIEGCYIGTDVTGTLARANRAHGISIGGSNNFIGGTSLTARNVISGNAWNGIHISRACCEDATRPISGNIVQGNYIGVNVHGNAALPNQREGIEISASAPGSPITGNIVGGTEPGAGNVISGNHFDGIELGSASVINNIVQGNFIGTDSSGNFAIPNDGTGVFISGSSLNLIGGATAGAGNVISGNGRDGSGVSGGNGIDVQNGSGNRVHSNIIGANVSLTAPVPNLFHGVAVNAPNSYIGGVLAGEANVIAFNGTDGIVTSAASSTGNLLRGNSIFSNGFLNSSSNASIGIDLGGSGPTPNDDGDGDTGGNNLQNFPVITSVTQAGSSLNVTGTLNSTASTSFAIDFYANSVCDALGYGEGARLIGSGTAMTDGSGNANFDLSFQGALPAGQVFTATATDPSGNTSEFSQCYTPTSAVGSISFSPNFAIVSEGGGTAAFSLIRTGGTAGSLTVGFSTVSRTATAGLDFTPAQGTLTFADGETSKMFTVAILEDSVNEIFETAIVTLNTLGPLDTLGSQSTATLTINDNDPLPTVSISDVSVIEGNSGPANAFFSVRLSASSGKPISMFYSTVNGTASSGSDFVPAALSPLTFSPGETSKNFAITINGDAENESDETFVVHLTGVSNASVARGQGTGTILNDDGSIAPLELILEELPPEPIQAAALDSVLLLRDPFPVINGANLLNPGPDRNTRVMVFVRNLPPGVVPASVTINLVDAANHSYNLVAEDVRSVAGCDCVQVIFRLPDDLTIGKSFVRIVTPTSSSNSGTIRIRL